VSENLQKLVGVAAMAALVVVGVLSTTGDVDFTRNATFVKLGDIKGDFKANVHADDGSSGYVPDGRNDGKLKLDIGLVNELRRDPIFRVKQDFDQFRYQGDSDVKMVDAVKLGGQEGEALGGQEGEALGGQEGEALGGQEGEALGGQEGEAFRSERRNVVAFGKNAVASVIVGDNHFRDVDDPAAALRKLVENKEPLMAEDKALGIRGPISKVVGSDLPTLAIQTDDGLTLGPLGGDGVFISIQDEALLDVDTSEYTEVEWTVLQKSLLEASKNLEAMAKQLEVWTNGNATSVRTDGS
jgi:hypothetical protein